MQKLVFPILIIAVLVIVVVVIVSKNDAPAQITNGVWYNKFFGEVGVTVGRTVVVKGAVAVPVESMQQYKPVTITVKNKSANFQAGSVAPNGTFEGMVSESSWYGTLVPGEGFKATITFQKDGGEQIERTGMFKKVTDDKAELK